VSSPRCAPTTVIACVSCGALLHQDSVAPDSRERLDCVNYSSTCLQCNRPLQTQEGWIDDVDD
jgi:hypothetical protein